MGAEGEAAPQKPPNRLKSPPIMRGLASGWPTVPCRVKSPPWLAPPPPSTDHQSIEKAFGAADTRVAKVMTTTATSRSRINFEFMASSYRRLTKTGMVSSLGTGAAKTIPMTAAPSVSIMPLSDSVCSARTCPEVSAAVNRSPGWMAAPAATLTCATPITVMTTLSPSFIASISMLIESLVVPL